MEGVEGDRRRTFGVSGGAEPNQLIVARERGPPVGRGEAQPLHAAHHRRELLEHCGERPVRSRGHEHAVQPVVTTLGVTTAVGGGVLRDVIARETPALVRPDSELYALPAVAGALTVAIAWEIDAYEPMLGALAAAAIFGIRVLALHHHWRGPRAFRRRSARPRARHV